MRGRRFRTARRDGASRGARSSRAGCATTRPAATAPMSSGCSTPSARNDASAMVFDDLVARSRRPAPPTVSTSPVCASRAPARDRGRARGQGRPLVLLQQLLKRPPRTFALSRKHPASRPLRQIGGKKAQNAPGKPQSLRKRLLRWNRVPTRSSRFPIPVQRADQGALSGRNRKARRSIGRDLGHWLQPRG